MTKNIFYKLFVLCVCALSLNTPLQLQAQPQCPELLLNTDFQQGNTGFVSQFIYNSNCPAGLNDGQYSIITNAANCGDGGTNNIYVGTGHTGSGNFMFTRLYDNMFAPPGCSFDCPIWSQNVTNLAPNANYNFSFYYMNANQNYSGYTVTLQVKINGVNTGSPIVFNTTNNKGIWLNFSTLWNSGLATNALIEVIFINDFSPQEHLGVGLDDVSFRKVDPPCCTSSSDPTGAIATPDNVCSGGLVNLSVVGGSLGTGASWKWYTGGCGSENGGIFVASGVSWNPFVYSTTTYYVRAEGSCDTTSCAQVTVTVNQPSAPPIGATATPDVVCLGNSTNLSLQGGSLGTGASWNWYKDACGNENGGTLIGTGTTVNNLFPTETTTYYVRAEGTCNTTSCVSVQVIVIEANQNGIISLITPVPNACVNISQQLTWNIASVPPLNPPITDNKHTVILQLATEVYNSTLGIFVPDWDGPIQTTFVYTPPGNPLNPGNYSHALSTLVTASNINKTYYWRVGIQYQNPVGGHQPITWSNTAKFILIPDDPTSPSETYLTGTGHTNNINWVYGISYLDNGKISEGIAYIDGLGKSRQVQSKLQSENKIMAVEAAYSEEGGGAALTLPAPLASGNFGFAHRFFDVVGTNGSKDFGTEDFDREIKAALGPNTLMTGTPVEASSEIAQYYSAANTDNYVDDAQGYPYSYNVAYKSPLQRPMFTAGGVGATFKITGGKEYEHFYGKPSQEELNRVYGVNNAPRDTNINRSITYDPNGVGYVTYKDNEGKMIATALKTCETPSLSPLNEDGMNGFTVHVNPLANNKMDNNNLKNGSSAKFLVPCTGLQVSISYGLDLDKFTISGIPCQTCKYDVNVRIVNENTGAEVLNRTRALIPSNAVCTGSPEQVTILDTIILLDGPANYIVNRTIKPYVDPVTGEDVVTSAINQYTNLLTTKVDSFKTIFSQQYYTDSAFYVLRQTHTNINAPAYLPPYNCLQVVTLTGTGDSCYTEGQLPTAEFDQPRGLTRDEDGNFYIVESTNNDVRKIDIQGNVGVLAGKACVPGGMIDAQGTNARFNNPYDVVYSKGKIFVQPIGSSAPNYTVTPIVTTVGPALYVADKTNNAIRKITLPEAEVSTLPLTDLTLLNAPEGLGINKAQDMIYVASTGNHKIYKVTLKGVITLVAGTGAAGNTNGSTSVASFYQPADVAISNDGIIYVADKGNHLIRKITGGQVTTFAGSGFPGSADGQGINASFNSPVSVITDGAGNVYVTDQGNHKIRKITPSGLVTTIAGTTAGFLDGEGTVAKFKSPGGLFIDNSGNGYVADVYNHRIRRGYYTRCGNETDPCTNGSCKEYLWYPDKVSLVDTVGTYSKKMIDLDGDVNNDNLPGDENYKLTGFSFQGSLNNSSQQWIDFVNAYDRMHWAIPSIHSMELYQVDAGSQLDQNNIATIQDDKSLNMGDLKQYYLLKVIISKPVCGDCEPKDLSMPCPQQCDEQKKAYEAEKIAAYEKVSESTTVYDINPFASHTLKELVDLFYPLSAYYIGLLNEADLALYNDYFDKRSSAELFNINDCLAICPNGTTDQCITCNTEYATCVFENMDELANGREYLLEKWDAQQSSSLPYTSVTQLINGNIVNPDEFEKLGENLFNFLVANFNDPYVNTRNNWDLQDGSCITCQPNGHSNPNCIPVPKKDMSQFSNIYLIPVGTYATSVLDVANQKCLGNYEKCFKLNGDTTAQKTYFCQQDKESCLSMGFTAQQCDSIYNTCVAKNYYESTLLTREMKIRDVLYKLYPSPADTGTVNTLAAQLLIQTAAKTMAELEEFLFYYESQQQCLINCENAFNTAFKQWMDEQLATATQTIKNNFISGCFGSMNESCDIAYEEHLYHYTLYKYDFANNLIATVPPEGIDYIDIENASQAERERDPVHRMQSKYEPNSLYTLGAESPDEGKTRYLYDQAGRARFSQTAEQRARGNTLGYTLFSYTKYDNEERVTEAGEYKDLTSEICYWSYVDCPTFGCPCLPGMFGVESKVNYPNWPSNTTNTFEETYIAYDVPTLINSGLDPQYTQTYLEGRVSKTFNSEGATHYSYDAHGRVKFSVQEINALSGAPTSVAKYKTTDYLYTTLTSRVDQIIYQKGNIQEEFRQKYTYDNDDRLVKTEVSRDGGLSWLNAADYSYYTHGPLKNKSLGNKIQDVDLTYNINGWLKAINNPISTGGFANEQGEGGTNTNNFAKDVFSEAINYYRGDYNRNNVGLDINSSTAPDNSTHWGNFSQDLYNGNIMSTVTNTAFNLIQGNNTPNILAQGYHYDILNRLTQTYAETQVENFTAFKPLGTGDNAYSVQLAYDANGNIQDFIRYSMTPNTQMDNMSYKFAQTTVDHYTNTKKTTNKLAHIRDVAGDLPGIADIIDQGAGYDPNNTSTHNYKYDEKGRIISDVASDIESIEWTVYDKVKKITHTSSSAKGTVEFTYNSKQQRLTKFVDPPGANNAVTTIYSYDASGILMSTYEVEANSYKLLEHEMYGMSRLGNYKVNEALVSNPIAPNNDAAKQRFELTDHLGSVRAVVSGVKDGSNNPEIVSLTDYDPFGMTMQGRSFVAENSRFSFQGKERDPELFSGYLHDFGDRMYEPRIGIVLTTDRKHSTHYPYLSPYSGMGGNPIANIDMNGELIIYFGGMWYGHGNGDWPTTKNDLYWKEDDGSKKLLQNAATRYKDKNSMFFNASASDQEFYQELLMKPEMALLSPLVPLSTNVYKELSDKAFGSPMAERYQKGYKEGQQMAAAVRKALDEEKKNGTGPGVINVIAHSMGVAYSTGFLQALYDKVDENGRKLFEQKEFAEWTALAAYQSEDINAPKFMKSRQFASTYDRVAGTKKIKNIQKFKENNYGFNPITSHSVGNFQDVFDSNPIPLINFNFTPIDVNIKLDTSPALQDNTKTTLSSRPMF